MRQLARTRHSPQPLQFAFKRVQPIARDIQSLRRRGGIENRKNSFDRLQKVGSYPASIAAFIEAFQTSMLEAANQQRLLSSNNCHLSTPVGSGGRVAHTLYGQVGHTAKTATRNHLRQW